MDCLIIDPLSRSNVNHCHPSVGQPSKFSQRTVVPQDMLLVFRGFLSPSAFGSFTNPLLSSPFSQDPFMQPTIKPHSALHQNGFHANSFNANNYGGYNMKKFQDGSYDADSYGYTGGEYKYDASAGAVGDSTEATNETKTDTELEPITPSVDVSSDLSNGATGFSGGFSKFNGGMNGFGSSPSFGHSQGFKPASNFGGPAGFRPGAEFTAGASGSAVHSSGKSPFGKSSGAQVDQDVATLMSMGFKRSVAKKALEMACNHLEVAINMLIGVSSGKSLLIDL